MAHVSPPRHRQRRDPHAARCHGEPVGAGPDVGETSSVFGGSGIPVVAATGGARISGLPGRLGQACFSSVLLHATVLLACAWVRPQNAPWETVVDRGQAVSLTMIAQSAEEPVEQHHPVRIVESAPERDTRPATPEAPQVAVVRQRVPHRSPDKVGPPPESDESTMAWELPRRQRTNEAARRDAPALTETASAGPRVAKRTPVLPAAVPVPVSIPLTGRNPGANVDQPARKLPSNPAPAYPLVARQRKEEGRVVLLVQLDAAGAVVDLELHASSGSTMLDQAALQAVRRWKFSPALAGGSPVTSQLLVPVRFSLHSVN